MLNKNQSNSTGQRSNRGISRLRRSMLVVMTVVLLTGLAAGCSSNESANSEQTDGHATHEQGHQLPNGDLQEWTKSVEDLPPFLNESPMEVQLVYQMAALNADLLQSMPCYCGCGESAGHMSNMNCFIGKLNDDGSVVWDDHGTRCGVCLEIAVEASKMKTDGVDDQSIRDLIDEKYKEGYAKPTPTPMPNV